MLFVILITNGLNVTSSELYETAKIVGSVFQNPRSQFFCVDTTSELAFGCENMGMSEAEILSRIDRVTEEMNISPLMGRNIFELSGGEKQKIAYGSVSALQPEIMVLDEPTSGLDFKHMEQTSKLLSSLKNRKTVFVVTHDPELISRCCTHIIRIENGRAAEFF